MQNNIVRILSFDPGLSISGWAVLDYHRDTGIMQVTKIGLLTPNKLVSRVNMRDDVEKYGNRIVALTALREMVLNLCEEFKPDYYVVEDNFFHFKYPTAYAALIHWTITVDLLIKDTYSKPVFKIPPKLVKHYITGSGDAKKINVQEAILINEKIKFKNTQMICNLIEHISDAIAIGWAFVHEYLPILKD